MRFHIIAMIVLSSYAFAASGSTGTAVVRVSDFGFDAADSTRFIKAAFDSGAKKVVFDKRQEGPWYAIPVKVRSREGVEVMFEDGAELCAKRGSFLGIADALLTFECCTNVVLRGNGRIRMWKADYVKPPYKKAEWRHAVSFLSCRGVLVEDLEIVESGGDGIYVSYVDAGRIKAAKWYCEDVVLRNVKCLRNHRQGVSVIGVKGFLAEGCVFSDTSGTSPQAGIDFEPNKAENAISDCVLRNCTMERNEGYGIDILLSRHDETTPPVEIVCENCISRDNERAWKANEYAGRGQLRGGSGRFVVRNCTFREKGGKDKLVSKEIVYGRPVVAGDGKRLSAMRAEDWDVSRVKVMDRRPGERVKLSPTRLRLDATFLFHASAPGPVSFKARQGFFRRDMTALTNLISIASWDGSFKTTAPAPAPAGSEFTVDVPAAGFYKMTWKAGWTAYFTLLESSVPVAIDALVRKTGRPPMFHSPGCTVYFPVSEGSGPFAAVAVGGNPGEGHRVTLKDPSGKTVFDRDNAELDDFWISPARPEPGLWSFSSSEPSAKTYDDYGFDLAGIPPLFFLSAEKYWTYETKERQ